jgi:hypothetical protein
MAIKDINHIPKLKAQLKQMRSKKVDVGILGDAELAMIFAVNEFGVDIKVTPRMRAKLHHMGLHLKRDTRFIKIPERATLRTTFDEKRNIDKVVKEATKIFDLNENPNAILNRIGLLMVAAVQRKIRSNVQPSNHPFTKEQKGGKNKTLISSGRTLQAVTHEIV